MGLLKLKELVAQSRIYEEKKLRALYLKTGFAVVTATVACIPGLQPLAFPLSVVGAVAVDLSGPTKRTVGILDQMPETKETLIDEAKQQFVEKKLFPFALKAVVSVREKAKKPVSVFMGSLGSALSKSPPRIRERFAAFIAQLKARQEMIGSLRDPKVAKSTIGGVAAAISLYRVTQDLNDYAQQSLPRVDNPYELLISENEDNIKGMNQLISQFRSAISRYLAMRDAALAKFKSVYCVPYRDGPHDRKPECE